MRHSLAALRRTRIAVVALTVAALVACVPPPAPTPAPAPAPSPTRAPVLVPPPSPVPSVSHWMDFPATPGDWTYAGGVARFGPPSGAYLSMRCDRASGVVELFRSGAPGVPVQMIIRSEALERAVSAEPAQGDPATLRARVPARDPLLDAMAFSKGRFAVETAGMPTLYVPSYPEVTRVIEDCR